MLITKTRENIIALRTFVGLSIAGFSMILVFEKQECAANLCVI